MGSYRFAIMFGGVPWARRSSTGAPPACWGSPQDPRVTGSRVGCPS